MVARQAHNLKADGSNPASASKPKHKRPGVSGYIYFRCRCAKCRRAWSIYTTLRNNAKRLRGLCVKCQLRTDPNSTYFCTEHLAEHRDGMRRRVAAAKVRKAREIAKHFTS